MRTLRGAATFAAACGIVLLGACAPRHNHVQAAPALTRAQVVHLVQSEVARAFALRDWKQYTGSIQLYTGPKREELLLLSSLDRTTSWGASGAGVRLLMYEDYECPYCKQYEAQTAPALRKRFGNSVLFVYRFFPLPMHGQVAEQEAAAGACVAQAGGQRSFERYTAQTFADTRSNGQGAKAGATKLARESLKAAGPGARGAALTLARCLKHGIGGRLVDLDTASFPISGTPTFFLVNVKAHKVWEVVGALPTFVFANALSNVLAGKPANSNWAVQSGAGAGP